MREAPRVLLLGDETSGTGPWRRILSRQSRVVCAEDIPEALSLLAEEAYDAVFCDWRFHCGTWREAVERIGALYPELPVVVVSQSDGIAEGIQEWAAVVEAGALDLLGWPLDEFAARSLLEHAVASGEARALRAHA